MEGSSEPAPVETPLADTPTEEKKTGWMKYAIMAGIAGVVLWVVALVLSIVSSFFNPLCMMSSCGGLSCCLGGLALVGAVVFVILGIMKV